MGTGTLRPATTRSTSTRRRSRGRPSTTGERRQRQTRRRSRPSPPSGPADSGIIRRMKVGIVVPYSWSFWGGVPEHADHQARALERLGVDARILIGHDPPGRLTKYLHPRVGRHERPPAYMIPVGRSVIVPANGALPNVVISPS